jgi:hypothetical protein
MTFAMVNVLPLPVTPSSVCMRKPFANPSHRRSIASGWSPETGQGAVSSNFPPLASSKDKLPPKIISQLVIILFHVDKKNHGDIDKLAMSITEVLRRCVTTA